MARDDLVGSGGRYQPRLRGVGLLVILPVILGYLAHAYWVFRGKTTLEPGGYDAAVASHAGRRTSAGDTALHLH